MHMSLTSPSPFSLYSVGQSLTQLPPHPSYRRNSTIDLPISRQSSGHDLPLAPSSSSSLRRSSTLDRNRDYSIPRGSSSEYRVPSSEYRAPSSEYRAPSSEYRVSNSEYRAP